MPEPIIPGALPYQLVRTIKGTTSCSTLQTDLSEVNFSQNDLKDSLCIEFDSKTEIGGTYIQGLYRRIQVNLVRCVPGPDTTCLATPEGEAPILTHNNLAIQSEFLRDFKI